MKLKNVEKTKSTNSMESDHIVFVDDFKNQLELFWWGHEVILLAREKSSFKFSKEKNLDVYNFLCKFAKQLESENKNAGGEFIKDNKFTWHHMSRAWDRPFEDEAGFVAKLNENDVEINFFPAKYKTIKGLNKNFISMGGPDGYLEPHQSISTLFALTLNKLLSVAPILENVKNDGKNL